MNKSGIDIIKSYELALEAETIATVEDNSSLIIDSKLAIIENLEYQNNLISIPEKLKEVEDLISNFDGSVEEKRQKLLSFNELQSNHSKLKAQK